MKSLVSYAGLAMFAAVVLPAEAANAQYWVRPPQAQRAPVARRAPSAPIARNAFRQPVDKPFANLQKTPTVSPYLNLTRSDGDLPNYQTLVRPELEQLEFNRQQQAQMQKLNRQFQEFRSQAAIPPGGDIDLRATGHATRFQNLMHFYPR